MNDEREIKNTQYRYQNITAHLMNGSTLTFNSVRDKDDSCHYSIENFSAFVDMLRTDLSYHLANILKNQRYGFDFSKLIEEILKELDNLSLSNYFNVAYVDEQKEIWKYYTINLNNVMYFESTLDTDLI